MKNLLQKAHYLSLDVVAGAVISHIMVARLPDGHRPVGWATTVLLAICVFVIYAADRLYDVRKNLNSNAVLTLRHRFHAENQHLLMRVLAGLVVMAVILLFWLPRSVLWFGAGLALISAAYVWGVSRLPASNAKLAWKEPVVTLLYTVGVWGSSWVQKPTLGWSEIGLAVLFLLIVFQNLLLFSVMETYEFPDNSYSLATIWGFDRSDVILRTLTVVITVLALVIFFMADDRFAQRAAIIEGMMSAVLYIIQRYPNRFLINERYRWIGDGVFWLPVLIL
ncbi:hypothetical protein EHT87_17255 [Larkinella knui]|uniref:Prenyltransferase n=1 Tax=Larkinella knui TaxID=2025310 RepID=A0A3P1CLT5_9BACT|nr:hypothetical protein EHT87_17255 [Larkinella knui]